MDKKTLPIIIILGLIVIFYFPIMEKLGFINNTPPAQPVDSLSDTTHLTGQSAPVHPQPIQQASTEIPVQDSIQIDTTAIDTIYINTQKYTLAMTSYGGGPISMDLNDYFYRDGNKIQMLKDAELVTPEASFAGKTFSASILHYSCNIQAGAYDASSSPLTVEYTYNALNGGSIVKSYTFYPDQYHYDLKITLNNPATMGFERKYSLSWNTPLSVTEPQANIDFEAMQAVAMQSGSRETLDDFEDDKLKQSLDGNTTWAGVREKYFASIIIPRSRLAQSAFAEGMKDNVNINGESVKRTQVIAGLEMPFANVEQVVDSYTVFVGPLDYFLMSDYDINLEDILDIGTTPVIGWLIKPFAIGVMWLLPKMYDIIPNYGLVIILFALLVKIITLPLSMKTFKSMQAMKELQPKIEEMKAKYKKNPQQLNQETMKLYKKHGVNPLSGCLPMLPQMPLLFALFSVFRSTILLRDAPFVWFISDLSRGASSFTDPYIILVVLMIMAQFVSQKITMASNTQQNKMMMYAMPLFFGFLFYKFSAGLVLYWTCFSIFSMIDYLLFKRDKVKNMHVQST